MKKLKKLLAVVLAVSLMTTMLVTLATANGQIYYDYAVDGGDIGLVDGLGYFYGVKYSNGTGDYAGSYDPNGLILYSADSTITSAVIPSTYSGYASSSSGEYFEEGEGPYLEDEPITAIQGITGGDSGAFYGCTLLTSVTIPSTVKYIYGGAFAGCTSLTEVIFEDNDYYCYVDGAIYTKDMTTLVCYIDGSRTSFVVPDTVTKIGDFAFVGAPSLTSITIPASVTTIGTGALTGNGLTTVTFEQGSQFVAEDNLIFNSDKTVVISYYGSVTGVTVPTSVTEISDCAFCGVDISGRTSSTSAGIRISNIYYQGTEAQWEAVTVGDGNMKSYTNVYYSCYSINVNDVENGTVTIWEDGIYWDNYVIDSTTYSSSEGEYFAEEGVTVTLTACGNYGYTLSDISAIDDEGNSVEVTNQGSYTYTFTIYTYTFTMPSSAVTVSVVFEEKVVDPTTYTVTIGETENGTVTADVETAEAGDTVTLTVTPADGYVVSNVTVTDANGNEVTVADDYSFIMPESDVTVSVVFEEEATEPAESETHTHTTETVIENYVAATATTDGSYDSITYCTECGEIISESHTVIAAYGSGSAEIIDWATVLASANSNSTTTTTVEDVVIEEPIEPTDTETEDDGEEPATEPAVEAEAEAPAETNPTTGVAISLIPMAIAALAAVSSKRK